MALYRAHQGKVSDKWSSYLTDYEEFFLPYLDRPIRILEIGVQNGGSLEIWSRYFPKAERIVGCDIDPRCEGLTYDDPRISVVVGDANTPETFARVMVLSDHFDIVIDDGSHHSRDIVRSFALYFPRVAENGLYVVEDLHCSYWDRFEGGIEAPYSAMSFFKRLTDFVNHEHWGASSQPETMLSYFARVWETSFDPGALDCISELRFRNSICAVSKRRGAENTIGMRVIGGSVALVYPAVSTLDGTMQSAPDQTLNDFGPTTPRLEEAVAARQEAALVRQEAALVRQELVETRRAMQAEQEWLLTELGVATAKHEQLRTENRLQTDLLAASQTRIAQLSGTVEALQQSPFWRVTYPFRLGLSKAPSPLRNLLRRMGKAIYWAITPHRIPARLAARRQISQKSQKPKESSSREVKDGAINYPEWIAQNDTLSDQDRSGIRGHIASLRIRPRFSVVMPVYDTPEEYLRQAIDSVLGQLYPHWELCIADDASPSPAIRALIEEYANRDLRVKAVFRNTNGGISACSNSALEVASGDWVVLLDHDDTLSEHALYLVANEINESPDAAIIYSDEDRIDAAGNRSQPYFKPDWNYELFLGQNLISHLGVYRADLVRRVGGFREGFDGSQDWDFALRVLDSIPDAKVCHIPFVLYHWRQMESTFSERSLAQATYAATRAVDDHFKRIGQAAAATSVEISSHLRIRRDLPAVRPLVSVVIPTKNKADLLRACIDGLVSRTDYKPIEIVVVDNDSDEEDALAFLADLRQRPDVKVIEDVGPFNFSRMVNGGVAVSSGEICILLNNDIDVINSGWLEEMVSHAARPDVGVVGAKLYYPNDTLQHGGVIIGLGGVAGHAHLGVPRSSAGYLNRLNLSHELSCVTGACLAVRREVYDEIGGFNEQDLAVSFNDVDFCIRVRMAGYKIIWTPNAELYHLESVSRGNPRATPDAIARDNAEVAYMREKWGMLLYDDPYYNPNLALSSPAFDLARTTRVRKPWLEFAQRSSDTNAPYAPAVRKPKHPSEEESFALGATSRARKPRPTQSVDHGPQTVVDFAPPTVTSLAKERDAYRRLLNSMSERLVRSGQASFRSMARFQPLLRSISGAWAENPPIVVSANRDPISADEKDGFIQRVLAIDDLFRPTTRIYLRFDRTQSGPAVRWQSDDVAVLDLVGRDADTVSFLDAVLYESSGLYVHSLYGADDRLVGYVRSGSLTVFDVHGAVPEERAMLSHHKESRAADEKEAAWMKSLHRIVVVTEKMAEHLVNKHGLSNEKVIVLPIFPRSVQGIDDAPRAKPGRPLLLYAGGTQIWQCLGEMAGLVSSLRDRCDYTILTPDKEVMIDLLHKAGVSAEEAERNVRTVSQAEVAEVCKRAHYGFMLREDSIVNRVACPTKLIEYLATGVVPIIKSPDIGDFVESGMAYVSATDAREGRLPSETKRQEMARHNFEVFRKLRTCALDSAARLKSLFSGDAACSRLRLR